MNRNRWATTATALMIVASLAAPPRAEGSALRVWFAGRGDYFNGTSDLFTEFDNEFGGGLEVGFEVVHISTVIEAVMLGQDQFLFTADAGLDFNFGTGPRFSIGLYTGPILFLFPESLAPTGVDFSSLSENEVQALLAATGASSLDEVEQRFDVFAEQEEDLGSLGFGWNLGRLRLGLDYPLARTFYVGVAGQLGYHMIISGAEVAAGAKNQVIDAYAIEYSIPEPLVERLREVVGAEPVDPDNLDGFNWDVNLYLRFEFGT